MSTTTKNITVKISAEISKFNSEMKNLSSKLKDASKEFEGLAKAGESVSKISKKFLPVTAGVAAIATVSGKTAIDFDSAMRQVSATMGMTAEEIADKTSKNGKDFEKLANCAREMGRQTKYSSAESAEALNYMALAGLDVEQSISLLPKVLNLASAGNMSLSTASDMVTDSMSALGIELQDADKFIDSMAKTSQKSNTSVEQLGEAILTVGGTAKNLSGGITEMNTVLGIFADNGIKGSEGGTALRNVIQSLSAPTDKAAKLMNELGLEVFDAEGNMRPLNETFGDLSGILGKMTQEEQTKVLAELFNKTDLPAVNALLANCGDRFNELSGEIANADGAAEKMAKTMNSGAGGAISTMKSSLESVAETIGKQFLPIIEKCADWISNLCNKFLELDPNAQQAITVFGLLFAAIAPVGMAVGGLMKGWSKLQGIATALNSPIGALIKSFGLKALAVIAVIAAIALLIAYWDEIKAWCQRVGEVILECWNNIVDWTKEKWNTMWETVSEWWSNLMSSIGEWLSSVGQAIVDGWNNCVNWTKDVWNTMWQTISEWWTNLVSSIKGWISPVADAISEGWNTCVEFTTELWNKVSEAVSNAWETIKNLVQVGLMFVGELIKMGATIILLPWLTLWENCKDFIMPIWENICSFVSEKLEAIKSYVSEKLEAVKTFFTDKFNAVKEKTTEIFETVANTVSDKLEKAKSYTSEKLESIKNFFSDKWNNVKEKTTEAYEKVSSTVSEKLDKAKGYTSEKLEAIRGYFSDKWTDIKGKTTDAYSTISSTVSEKLEQAKSYVSDKLNAIKSYFADKLEQAKSTVTSKMDSIKKSMQDKINSAKDAVNNAVNTIKSKFDIFGTIASNVSSKFDTIKTNITNKINSAKDAVSNAINKMKSILNITLPFPKIKLPHFKISGGFSLNPPKVPSFSVQWYNRGGIFRHKTVLPNGIGVGDASFGGVGNNAEAILPINKLPELLGLDKRQNDGGLQLNIQEFNNNRDYDIERLADELAYYLRRKQAIGGA